MRPQSDVDIAKEKRLRFYVSNKAEKGGAWNRVYSCCDLDSALVHARTEGGYEVAVFVQGAEGGYVLGVQIPGRVQSRCYC